MLPSLEVLVPINYTDESATEKVAIRKSNTFSRQGTDTQRKSLRRAQHDNESDKMSALGLAVSG
jgi:hypothetical protein